MITIRSWPAQYGLVVARPHVVDRIQRFPIENYDYRGLVSLDDDVVLLEWDMAISQEDLEEFQRRASKSSDIVRVAPYRLYESRLHPVWAHRLIHSTTDVHVDPSEDSTCDLFGFGCVYLPHQLIKEFIEEDPRLRCRDPRYHGSGYLDERLTDQTFSTWHYWHKRGPSVPIDWELRPVHLNWGEDV